jgi:ubiquinone/menaquinone biosynthesis C-methylase UbiE
MDKIFNVTQALAYEQWLDSPAGGSYLRASRFLIDNIMDFRPGWRVLDIGCGLGLHLAHLRDHGALTFGLEASPLLKQKAQEQLGPKTEIKLGDAYSLPYDDNSFDAVLMINSLEYMDRPALALAEAARVSSGRLCLVSFNSISCNRFTMRQELRPLRFMGLMRLQGLARQVLGKAPQTWRAAGFSRRPFVSRLPIFALVGVCAAVSPRFLTTPLLADMEPLRRNLTQARGMSSSLRAVKPLPKEKKHQISA